MYSSWVEMECRHLDEIFLTGCTRSCQNDFWCDENYAKMSAFRFQFSEKDFCRARFFVPSISNNSPSKVDEITYPFPNATVAPFKFGNWKVTLYNGCTYLSMLTLKFIYVSKRGLCKLTNSNPHPSNKMTHHWFREWIIACSFLTWTNGVLLSVVPQGTNYGDIWAKYTRFL